MKQKFLKMLLAALAILCLGLLIASHTLAESPIVYNDISYTILEDGTAAIVEHRGQGSDLIIPETVDGYTVSTLGDSLFQNRSGLLEIHLPDGITRIGNHAFEGCTGLQALPLLPNLTHIGDYAFADCASLERVVFSTKLAHIGEYAFANCMSLPSVKLPNALTALQKGTFFSCSNLQTADLGIFLQQIGEDAFAQCINLHKVWFPQSLQEIGKGAFFQCDLQSLDLHMGLRRIGERAFEQNHNLMLVSLGEGLQSLDMRAFAQCNSLLSVSLPKSLTRIENSVFDGSDQRQIHYAPANSYAYQWMRKMKYAVQESFLSKNGLYLYSIQKGNVNILRYLGEESIVSIEPVIDHFPVTSIGVGAFCDSDFLKSVYIPDYVQVLGENAFSHCIALQEVHLGSGLRSIEQETFYDCRALKIVSIPASVKYIGDFAFYACPIEVYHIEQGSWAEGWAIVNTYDYRYIMYQ